jgi:hypothetical protein
MALFRRFQLVERRRDLVERRFRQLGLAVR